ncbi:hypothetical protein [Catenuloplanes atrovinosus]|uniref:Uncharacterized protein n=1 Tax=Catenuloplanes atrovinosus TaxID=137266 RepID=A0AAE3YQ64_9ACTN|nr:hypothetical protein [Catenuloplanes atrovinosus]MDR7277640.1 hypothetical protein [Catenuloplanes atrovinosus]
MAHARSTRKPRKKYQPTPEQIAATEERDRALHAEAAAAMADPDVIRQRVAQALGPGIPAQIRRWSLRNVLLILSQAEQRGITLTDVDTKSGWAKRGRRPAKGQTGLRIVRPVGAIDSDDSTDEATDAPATDAQDESIVRFRMVPRWDISQTVPFSTSGDDSTDAVCSGCDAAPGEPCRPACICLACGAPAAPDESPADALWNNLTDQITRAGYRFVWPDGSIGPAEVRADHDARAAYAGIAALSPEGLADLAVILGEIITRASRRRAALAPPAAP